MTPFHLGTSSTVTLPVMPLTLCTASVGVKSSTQLDNVLAGDCCKINDLLISLLTATSPCSAPDKANIAACEATGKVSDIAKAGICEFGTLPSAPNEA
ncbi:hypothetical protein D3C87_964270 [compost metagenome]